MTGAAVAPRRRWLAAALWAAAGALAVARLLGPSSSPDRFGTWYDVLTIPFFAVAGAGALVGGAARSGRAARGWRTVAGAWLLSALGYLVWLPLAPDQPAWLSDTGAVLYTLYYPLMTAGLLLLAARPAGLERRLRALLEVVLVTGTTQLMVWWFSLRVADVEVLAASAWNVIPTAVGETAVLAAAAWLLASAGTRPDGALRLLGAGAVVAALSDLAAMQFQLGIAPGAGRWSDAGLVVSAALVASAGLVRPVGDPDRRALALDLASATLGHVPTLAVLAVLGLLVATAWGAGGPWPVVALATAGLSAVALLALALARRELDREAAERASQAERLAATQRLVTVGHLAGAAAHDFSNLSVAIGDIARELREAPLDQATVDDLEGLARRAAALCRRLLDMARGTGELRTARHDLAEALASVHPLLRRLVPPRIRVELAVAGPVMAAVDLAQLELALVNLVVNARDAIAGEGTITVSARREAVVAGQGLGARGVPPGPHAVVSVSDDGAGMDAATLARASEPFFTTKPPGQGTGLGLSLVRDLAGAAGGRLVLESAAGAGATVSLVLPAAATLELPLADGSNRSQPPSPPGR